MVASISSLFARYAQIGLSLGPANLASRFAEKLVKLVKSSFIPSDSDILHAYRGTDAIDCIELPINKRDRFRIVDAGSEGIQRQQWPRLINEANVIVVCVDASGYDKASKHAGYRNVIEEACALFATLVNSPWTKRLAFIVLFTHMDHLEKKLEYRPLSQEFFTDVLEESSKKDDVVNFYKRKFLAQAQSRTNPNPHIEFLYEGLYTAYRHFSNTWQVGDQILQSILQARGLAGCTSALQLLDGAVKE